MSSPEVRKEKSQDVVHTVATLGFVERILSASVKHRVLVLVLTAIFFALGLQAAFRVPIDAVPDVTNVQVQVITSAPTLGPLDVESHVTFPVEKAMAGLPGLEEVRSISRAGISVVTCVFADGVDLYGARAQVAQRLDSARREIPTEFGDPELGPVSSGLGEVFHFELRTDANPDGSPRHPLLDRRTFLDWTIAPRLRLVPGVVEVNAFGGAARSLEISLDPSRLAANRVGVSEVVDAIKRNHISEGGAYLVSGREHVTVRGEGRIASREDLENVVVLTRETTPLYVRDLGVVRDAPLVRYGAVTRDGRADEAVVGVVMMLRGANSGEVVRGVKEAIADIETTLPAGMHIDAYYDRTALVDRTIHTVGKNLIEASLLVLLVLFVTLGSFRAGLVVAITIPLALLGVFLGMSLGGISGNLVSLGAIDFGLVVDGAIIIVENALHRLAERRAQLGRPLTDQERSSVVVGAAREVRKATAFGEAIIALVYVPIIALQSIEGRMFRPMALTVLFALATAFVLSLTLVPALASWILPKDPPLKQATPSSPLVADEGRFAALAHRLYAPLLARTLRAPRLVTAVAVGLFFLSIGVASRMGREFLPKLDEGTMVLAAVRLPSVSLDQSLAMTRKTEEVLKRFPEVTSVVSRTGRAEIAVDPMGINMTDVYVLLKPKEEWTTAKTREELIEIFDKALSGAVPGTGFAFSQPIEMNTNDLLAGIESDLAVHLYGNDLVQLRQTADAIVRSLKTIPGAKDVRAEQIAGMSVLSAKVDRAAVGRAGVDAQTVLATIAAVGGIHVGEFLERGVRVPIVVRLDGATRSNPELLAQVPVKTANGTLPTGQLVTFETTPGPSQIGRERLSRRITVQLDVRGRDVGSFVEEAKKKLGKDVKLPTGYYTVWAGEYERLQSATHQLAVVVPIALVLIVVLLALTFGRFRPALLIFLNVPMATSGGLLALALRGEELSISAGVGMIALFGVAVLNGLVLVTNIEERRDAGAPLAAAVRDGAESRLRPVLTTALVASLGFLPMMLAHGAGAEVQRPLATVVVGGIVTSTLLTLFVLPALYEWLGGRSESERDLTASASL